MPQLKTVKVVEINKVYYVAIPKTWMDYYIKNGKLKRKEDSTGKLKFFLEMVTNGEITIQIPTEITHDISIGE